MNEIKCIGNKLKNLALKRVKPKKNVYIHADILSDRVLISQSKDNFQENHTYTFQQMLAL